MASSRNQRSVRPFLQVEYLEDRTNPSPIYDPSLPVYNPSLSLSDQVAANMIKGDRILVSMNAGASIAALGTPAGVSQVKSLGFDVYSVVLTPGSDLGGTLAYYAGKPGVLSAETDQMRFAEKRPNDTSYSQEYGTVTTGAQLAWNVTTGNPNFVVGVIDTGVDYTHPDLAANIWTNPREIAGDGIDNDGNGYIDDIHGWDFVNNDNDPMDDIDHGTHVAGTIGAVGNNGVGVAGINWSVKIMALKFLGPNGGSTSDAISAINYATKMGVKVTNNSWGGGGFSTALAQAIGGARAAGDIFVAAAGNGGYDGIGDNNDAMPFYPASYSLTNNNMVTVAAVDNKDQLGSFSNYGATSVNIAAPGVAVLSTVPGGYDTFDGTSMATPHVTGAIALYWGANPKLTYQQVIAKLYSSVDKLDNLTGMVSTGGRLNVANMFGVTPTVPPVVLGAPAGTEVVRELNAGGTTRMALDPHPGFLGGVVAASGDVNGDGVADVVTAAVYGGHVKVFDGATGAEIRSFYAFPGYSGPISVAIGDLTGDRVGDIIVSANTNGHVKVFNGLTGQLTFSALVYQGYFGTVQVSAADTDGDGRNELITAADAGFGVHVKAFAAGTQTLRESFLATDKSSWNSGFSLAAIDLDGDELAEIVVSQGPRVRIMTAQTKAVRADFLAFDPLLNDPVTIQVGRYTGNKAPDVVAVRESKGTAQVKVFDGPDFTLADTFVAGTR